MARLMSTRDVLRLLTTMSAPSAIFASSAESVTGSRGGLSMMTKSYFARTSVIRWRKPLEPISEAGLGGMGPARRTSSRGPDRCRASARLALPVITEVTPTAGSKPILSARLGWRRSPSMSRTCFDSARIRAKLALRVDLPSPALDDVMTTACTPSALPMKSRLVAARRNASICATLWDGNGCGCGRVPPTTGILPSRGRLVTLARMSSLETRLFNSSRASAAATPRATPAKRPSTAPFLGFGLNGPSGVDASPTIRARTVEATPSEVLCRESSSIVRPSCSATPCAIDVASLGEPATALISTITVSSGMLASTRLAKAVTDESRLSWSMTSSRTMGCVASTA